MPRPQTSGASRAELGHVKVLSCDLLRLAAFAEIAAATQGLAVVRGRATALRMRVDVIAVHQVEGDVPPAQVADPSLSLPSAPSLSTAEHPAGVEGWLLWQSDLRTMRGAFVDLASTMVIGQPDLQRVQGGSGVARRKAKRRSKQSWSVAGVVSGVAALYVFAQVGQNNGVAGLVAGVLTFFAVRAGIRWLSSARTARPSSPGARATQPTSADGVKLSGKVVSEPQVVPWLLDHWDQANDELVSRVENEMKGSGESNLLYALRVAGPGLRAKTLKTLVSRWRTTRCGAADSGLDAGRTSPNHARLESFLMAGFSERLNEVAQEDLTKALDAVGKKKSEAARGKAAQRAADKYEDAIAGLEESDGSIYTAAEKFRAKYREALGEYLDPSGSAAAASLSPNTATSTASGGGHSPHRKADAGRSLGGGHVLNPGAPFKLTLLGVSPEQVQSIRELLESDEGAGWPPPLFLKLIDWDVRCNEIDEYVAEFKPVFEANIAKQQAASPEWSEASELDREDLLSEFRQKAVGELDVQPYGDLEVLLGESSEDVDLDDALMERYGVDAVYAYVSNYRRVGKVQTIAADHRGRNAFEKLVSAGLARRGKDIPIESVAQKLRLKDIQELIQDLDPPRFRRKAEAVDFLVGRADAAERLEKKVAWRELFELAPLPHEFSEIDIDRVSAYWRHARAVADLLQHTYMMAAYSLRDVGRDDGRGWEVLPAPDACPACKRAEQKRYSKGAPPPTPLHVGCRCSIVPMAR